MEEKMCRDNSFSRVNKLVGFCFNPLIFIVVCLTVVVLLAILIWLTMKYFYQWCLPKEDKQIIPDSLNDSDSEIAAKIITPCAELDDEALNAEIGFNDFRGDTRLETPVKGIEPAPTSITPTPDFKESKKEEETLETTNDRFKPVLMQK